MPPSIQVEEMLLSQLKIFAVVKKKRMRDIVQYLCDSNQEFTQFIETMTKLNT